MQVIDCVQNLVKFFFFFRDGSIALCSLQDGGLLGQWEDHVQPEQQVDAVVFEPGKKDLLAFACAQTLTVLTCPWQQKPCTAVSCYTCPQVSADTCSHTHQSQQKMANACYKPPCLAIISLADSCGFLAVLLMLDKCCVGARP